MEKICLELMHYCCLTKKKLLLAHYAQKIQLSNFRSPFLAIEIYARKGLLHKAPANA